MRFRGRKSSGWVPFDTGRVSFEGAAFTFRGVRYIPMHLRDGLKPDIKVGAGGFNQDARGRWDINVAIEVACAARAPNTRFGITSVLKILATLSDERDIEIPRCYRDGEEKLTTIQRAKKTPKPMRNPREDCQPAKGFPAQGAHEDCQGNGLVVVGNASSSELAKINVARTNIAKCVLDAGWSGLRNMLACKAMTRGGIKVACAGRGAVQRRDINSGAN